MAIMQTKFWLCLQLMVVYDIVELQVIIWIPFGNKDIVVLLANHNGYFILSLAHDPPCQPCHLEAVNKVP